MWNIESVFFSFHRQLLSSERVIMVINIVCNPDEWKEGRKRWKERAVHGFWGGMLLLTGVRCLSGNLMRSVNGKKSASLAVDYYRFLLTRYLGEKKMFEMGFLQIKARYKLWWSSQVSTLDKPDGHWRLAEPFLGIAWLEAEVQCGLLAGWHSKQSPRPGALQM